MSSLKKIKMKLFIIILMGMSFFAYSICDAQYYTGIGLRVGKYEVGLSAKHFLFADNSSSLEGIFASKWDGNGGLILTGLYEHQTPFHAATLQVPLSWIYGGRIHAGYFNSSDFRLRKGLVDFYPDHAIVAS